MGRPRAGHGWTLRKDGVPLLMTADGKWVTTIHAMGWKRCDRCRKPEQYPQKVGDQLWCIHCYYYKHLSPLEFWAHKDDYLFPYNIGDRLMASLRA